MTTTTKKHPSLHNTDEIAEGKAMACLKEGHGQIVQSMKYVTSIQDDEHRAKASNVLVEKLIQVAHGILWVTGAVHEGERAAIQHLERTQQ